jgi:aryl-alcohol dehydrogenase-like predicted oxidoreductase
MHLAIDHGVNFVDTAMGYGDGHSEKLIAQVLRDRSERVYVATKIRPMNYNFGPQPGDSFEEAFSKDWLVSSTERSLQYLGVERLDMQMLHVWVDDWASCDEWKEAVVRLKDQGKIGAFGLSLVFPLEECHIPRAAIATDLIDFCQVVYNIYEQEPQDELFPLALREQVGIIARCPLDEGALTGTIKLDTTFPKDDWRNNYFGGDRKQQVIEHAEALQWLVDGDSDSLAQAALRFCISHPAVSTVIAGMRQPHHVRANVEASVKGPLSEQDLERLKQHAWPHNFWV